MVESPNFALPKNGDATPKQRLDAMERPRGAQVPIVGKYGYSAGRRQSSCAGERNPELWEWIKGECGPQEEKIREGKQRSGMKGEGDLCHETEQKRGKGGKGTGEKVRGHGEARAKSGSREGSPETKGQRKEGARSVSS